jgi:hypothetical protein
MKKADVQIGQSYTAKISGQIQSVRITRESPYGGWLGVNPATGREIRIRTAAKLRRAIGATPRYESGVAGGAAGVDL